MRKVPFIKGEYCHIFNRGVDKRNIFMDKYDAFRFLQGMNEFNNVEKGNNIFRKNKSKNNKVLGSTEYKIGERKRLVNIVCYCLNPNHYHFIIEQLSEGGISEFMKRLGGGYTKYNNEKYKRSGVLFQGKFKSVHKSTNEQLLHVSAYVNLNNIVHKKLDGNKKNFLDLIPNRSSWNEYIGRGKSDFCKKNIILRQFKNIDDIKNLQQEL